MSRQVVRFGRSKVTVSVAGCHGCGEEFPAAWVEVRPFEVSVAGRRMIMGAGLCGRCSVEKTTRVNARRRR